MTCWLVAGALAGPAAASDKDPFSLELEAGPIWQSRNDVRIPNETGTEFSLVDVIGSGPYFGFRVQAAFDIAERHGFRFVYAPLEFEDTGVLDRPVMFADTSFDPDTATEANYKFSSYRVTYRYRIYDGGTWRWKLGATLFVRDARIALRQGDVYAEDTDVGLVPLVHLRGEARMGERWRFLLDVEGLGASQGRAFDIAAKLGYSLSEDWELGVGYRTIEGGADVEDVYNFAWLHSLVGSLRYSF